MKIKNILKPPPSRDYIFKFATGEGGEITFFILFLSPSKGQESGYFLNTFRFQHLNPDKNTELYPKFKLIPMHPQKWLRDVLLNLRFVCFFSCFFLSTLPAPLGVIGEQFLTFPCLFSTWIVALDHHPHLASIRK